jgi:tetratricopeptide (TPR) repeat protein
MTIKISIASTIKEPDMADLDQLYKEHEQLKAEGKLDEAHAKLQQCLEADESYVMGHLGMAVLMGRMGKHDEAVKHGERACELEPTEPFNYTAMSVTYQRAYAGTGDMSYIQKAEDAMAKAHSLQGMA